MLKENFSDLVHHYPEDILESLKQAISNNKNIHIHGKRGAGKSTLLGILAQEIKGKKKVIYISQYQPSHIMDELFSTGVIRPPSPDPWYTVLRQDPDAIIVDSTEGPRTVMGERITGTRSIGETEHSRRREEALWSLTNKHTQVLSAGEDSVSTMNEHLLKSGIGSYAMNYDIDVEIKKETKDGDVLWFPLEINEVKHLRSNKPKGMRHILQSISKPRSSQ